MIEITKRFRFEAHHVLPWHTGKCARDHGHSYVLEVSVRGEVKPDDESPDSGMVRDFAEIGAVVKPLIESRLDHHSINDILKNPTAERLLEWVVEYVDGQLPGLSRVRVYETADCWAEWTR